MVHMPSLENWKWGFPVLKTIGMWTIYCKWGLKIFDGAPTFTTCGNHLKVAHTAIVVILIDTLGGNHVTQGCNHVKTNYYVSKVMFHP